MWYHDSAIVFYTWNDRLNGSLINAFEYFLCAFEYNPDIKLILLDCKKSYLKHFLRIVKERYRLHDLSGYEDNILLLPRTSLLRTKFGRALVLDYGSIEKIKGLLCAKSLLIITEILPEQKEYILRKKRN